MPQKGFFASLFDLSFSSFITTKIVKFLYVLTLVILGLIAIVFVVAAFEDDPGLGALTLLVLAPLGFLFYAIYTRVFLEFIMAVFRIAETNTQLVTLTRGEPAAAVSAAAPAAPGARISDDGEYWWDGTRWQSLRQSLPPGALRSPDGAQFHDGSAWRPVPGRGGEQTTQRTVIKPDDAGA